MAQGADDKYTPTGRKAYSRPEATAHGPRRGRPILHTDEREEIAIDAVSKGATRKVAARLAGVSGTTLQKWISQYPEFRKRIREADAVDEVSVVMQLRQHFGKEWRAIAYYLDRRHQWQMRSESHGDDSGDELGELVVGRTDGAALHVHPGASVEDVRASVGLDSDLPPAPKDRDEEPEQPAEQPADESGGMAYHVADSKS